MHCRISFDIAILGAISEEVSPLVPLLENGESFAFLGQVLWTGARDNSQILLATTGLGKVNAAAVTAALLERFSIAQVWNIGSAGAYTEGPLEVGDVLITVDALCGDEGVLEKGGISSVARIGIPIAARGERVLYDRIPLHAPIMAGASRDASPSGIYRLQPGVAPRSARFCRAGREVPQECGAKPPQEEHFPETLEATGSRLTAALPPDAFKLFHGPSLTVGMSSGDAETASQRFRRYGAFAENMEGSAVAQTCFLFDVPMAECRGISNVAGDRNRDRWQLRRAMDHCHGIVLNWLECFPSRKGF